MADPNWAEQVTAVATAVGAVGLVSTLGLVVFGARQVREVRESRQAQMAADFLRRWDEDALVEARRLVASFADAEQLRDAFLRYVETNAPEAYVLYRELDYFEQLAALEELGAFHFDLIDTLLGSRLVDRFELWKPSLDAMGDVYPMFASLVAKLRRRHASLTPQ
ncbi:MAG TPA: hypothetical protein VFW74_15680 [Acidimicrobiia bacterium]|nr:hypothetical protein [Acidimicrobiia bacterium]